MDEDERELERRVEAGTSEETRALLLSERARRSPEAAERIALAAFLGDPAARAAANYPADWDALEKLPSRCWATAWLVASCESDSSRARAAIAAVAHATDALSDAWSDGTLTRFGSELVASLPNESFYAVRRATCAAEALVLRPCASNENAAMKAIDLERNWQVALSKIDALDPRHLWWRAPALIAASRTSAGSCWIACMEACERAVAGVREAIRDDVAPWLLGERDPLSDRAGKF